MVEKPNIEFKVLASKNNQWPQRESNKQIREVEKPIKENEKFSSNRNSENNAN
jgi:hypothetical protein